MAKHSIPRAIAATVAALLVAGTLQACDVTPVSKTYPPYRYRLTAEVETPEGLRTGSSVIEVRVSLSANWLGPIGGSSARARGEAVTVDLGRRGVFFVLLKNAYDADWAIGGLSSVVPRDTPMENYRLGRSLPNAFFDPVFEKHMARLFALRGPHVVKRWHEPRPPHKPGVPVSGYPLMVRFDDLADPKSVQLVDPERLDAAFGKGVAFRRLVVERTFDRVTTGIEKRLPWLNTAKQSGLDNDFAPTPTPTLAQRLGYLDFRKPD